jgi:hypothetical protein
MTITAAIRAPGEVRSGRRVVQLIWLTSAEALSRKQKQHIRIALIKP